ncbi:conserved hypothetical protein [Gloeothece citriformis PCC 7424]|uniref:PEP-CTERM protein-sorting domain-containing protein n=1 Tax=Gloeothece citriformis (strain PCC 7424) TaxID=65393 RepID=B7K6X3_GLOC7|nr:PEP-CTERM sorting domain-containing protein [Gloeothece citriformis]ACK72672.1 conserved hypothetical protein [Gloeothece citriformis PCC 7424]
MIQTLTNPKTIAGMFAVGSTLTLVSSANALTIRVTIENIAPEGGTYLTPVWVGFHNGSFDSYNGGLPSELGLERIAEDGDVSQVTADFAANLTYIDNSTGTPVSATLPAEDAGLAQTGTRVQGTLGAAPIGPGSVVSQDFDIATDGSNTYFSYLSMVLPSNDYYVANGNPFAHSLSSLFSDPNVPIVFNIGLPGTVNDAGTEINNFNTSAGNGFFPGLPQGQTGGNQGADEGGINANVGAPYGNFLNTPPGFNFANLNFNNASLYPNGIGQVTITVVPEPLTILGVSSALGFGAFFKSNLSKKQRKSKKS